MMHRKKAPTFKVLIGYDGSATAKYALKGLAKAGLPRKADAIILVATPPLIPFDSPAMGSYAVPWFVDAYKEAVSNVRADASKAKAGGSLAVKRLKKCFPGWKITLESPVDAPSHALLKRADDWMPDLIVIGSHGWTPLGKMLLGSISEKWPRGTVIKMVAVSDFKYRLDQISLSIRSSRYLKKPSPDPWLWMETRLAKARVKLAQPGVQVDTSIIEGDPREILLAEAKKFKADSLFLGSRGKSGMRRFMLGSVSTAVASHSPCSVEIIRRFQVKS